MSIENIQQEKFWWENFYVITDNHPKQKEIYDDPHQKKVISCGSGFGKTVLIKESAIRKALKSTVKGGELWIVAPNNEAVKDIYWYDLLNRINFLGYDKLNPKRNKFLIDANERDKKIYVRNAGGNYQRNDYYTEIALKSAEAPKTLAGHTIIWLGIDEMFLIPKKIWTQYLHPRATRGNAEVFIISTPNGHDHFWELWELGNNKSPKYNPNWKSWQCDTWDNPLYTEQEIREAGKDLNEWEFNQIYRGSFDLPTGRVYLNFDDNKNVKHEPIHIDYSLPLYMTWDFNAKNMATSICQVIPGNAEYQLLIEKKSELMLQLKDAELTDIDRELINQKLNEVIEAIKLSPVKEQQEVLNVIKTFFSKNYTDSEKQSEWIKEWLNEIGWTGKIMVYGDSSGGAKSSVSEKTNWSNIRHAFDEWETYYEYPKSNPDPVDRINAVNRKLRNTNSEIGIYVNFDECKQLITDFQQVTRKANGEVDKDRLERLGMNHAVEGLGYLIHKRFPIKRKSYANILTEDDFKYLL